MQSIQSSFALECLNPWLAVSKLSQKYQMAATGTAEVFQYRRRHPAMYLNTLAISALSTLQQRDSADSDAHRDRHIRRKMGCHTIEELKFAW